MLIFGRVYEYIPIIKIIQSNAKEKMQRSTLKRAQENRLDFRKIN